MTTVPDFTFLPYYLSEVVSYFTLVGSAYLAWRVVRAYERRSLEPERLRALASRVQYLEAAIETVEGQVRQTAEAQRFTAALLGGPSVGMSHQSASNPDGRVPQVT